MASKDAIRKVIAQVLAKALAAIGKLIKTKVLPKATEKYCENLHKFTKKLGEKTDKMIDSIVSIKDTKKLVGTLFALKLVKETTVSIADALKSIATQIETEVDFSPLEAPETDEVASVVAELEVLANAGDEGCGPDGCEIA